MWECECEFGTPYEGKIVGQLSRYWFRQSVVQEETIYHSSPELALSQYPVANRFSAPDEDRLHTDEALHLSYLSNLRLLVTLNVYQ